MTFVAGDGQVRSPVTGGPTSIADRFNAGTIIARWERQGFDVRRYFDGLEDIELRRCRDTGYRFFYPQRVAGEAEFYDMMDPGFSEDPDYRHWSDEFQFALDRIRPDERVLDVGCRYGYFVERAAEHAKASGLDANAHAQRRAGARGLDVWQGTAEDFAAELTETFDVVCTFQTLEHIFEVSSFFKALRRMLKPGGRLIVAVPNNEPYLERFNKYATFNTPPHHVGLWDRRSLRAAGCQFALDFIEDAYLDMGRRPLVSAYLRAASWMGVESELHHHRPFEQIKILTALPFALPLAFAELAITGRTMAENIAMVFRKPT